MTAQIISLADRRAGKAPLRRAEVPPLYGNLTYPEKVALERRMIRDIAQNIRGVRKPSVSERIQKIADNLGIDLEAPFRGEPSKPTKGSAR